MRVAHVVEAAIVIAGIAATSWWVVHARHGNPAVREETAAKPSSPKLPDVSTEEGSLADLRENHLAAADTLWREANLAGTSPERQLQLYKQVVALDERFVEKAGPLLDKPKYQAAEYEWLQRGIETSFMRLRMTRDRIRSAQPPAPAQK